MKYTHCPLCQEPLSLADSVNRIWACKGHTYSHFIYNLSYNFMILYIQYGMIKIYLSDSGFDEVFFAPTSYPNFIKIDFDSNDLNKLINKMEIYNTFS